MCAAVRRTGSTRPGSLLSRQREPTGGAVLGGQVQVCGEVGVGFVEALKQGGMVAFARQVQQHEVVGRFARGGDDALHGVERLFIRQMTVAAHDAVLEHGGAGRGELQLAVVVGFDGEEVHVGHGVDEGVGDAAEVGGVTEPGGGVVDDEAAGSVAVVVEGDWLNARCVVDAGQSQGEGLIAELVQQAGGVEEVRGSAGGGGVDGVIDGGAVALVEVEGDAPLKERVEPGGGEVISVGVGEEDDGDVVEGDAGVGESLGGGAGSEAGVNENCPAVEQNERAVAG